jgi:cell division protease FtsH
MVKEFGMSRLGRVSYQEHGSSFLPTAGPNGEREYSEQTAREIDVEVHKILDDATAAVREVLLARREALEAIAQRLMEKEVIDGRELRQLLEQHSPGPRLVPGSEALPAAEPPRPPGPVGLPREQTDAGACLP